MDRTGSKFMKSREMQLGAVALVLPETILGKLRAEVAHDSVARDLRDDARGGDGQAVAIAVDDCSLWKGKRKNGKPIDQNMLRQNRERSERDSHRFMRRSQNIDPVNLKMIDNTNAPGDFRIIDELVVNFFAKLRVQLLGIVQLSMPKLFWQNNCGCDYRSGERAAARFVNPGNSNDSRSAQFLFVTKSAAPIHLRRKY